MGPSLPTDGFKSESELHPVEGHTDIEVNYDIIHGAKYEGSDRCITVVEDEVAHHDMLDETGSEGKPDETAANFSQSLELENTDEDVLCDVPISFPGTWSSPSAFQSAYGRPHLKTGANQLRPISVAKSFRHMTQRPISHSSRNRLLTGGRPIVPRNAVAPVSRLEKTYTSWIPQLGIALPINEEECLKRVHYLAFAKLHEKGTPTSSFVQHIQGEQHGVDANNVSHILWVGRQWDSILSLFDSIVQKLGKKHPTFKPHGLMVLLKAGYT
ncbi:hypothetical protein J7T55_009316, partial [Diaporthe amygdali]|uniref:uncharacterized protein n=1 Tax=Phomopsis amygdali TaxID=1214568 RepID=UPI0022FED12A